MHGRVNCLSYLSVRKVGKKLHFHWNVCANIFLRAFQFSSVLFVVRIDKIKECYLKVGDAIYFFCVIEFTLVHYFSCSSFFL